jgi:hypothetical protein
VGIKPDRTPLLAIARFDAVSPDLSARRWFRLFRRYRPDQTSSSGG